jgi:hypothetical protein
MARDMIAALRRFDDPSRPGEWSQPVEDGLIGQALVAQAILLYSRATHTTSRDRVSVHTKKVFTKGQREAHERLVDLRNNVLAHFGHGAGRNEGPWVSEVMVLKVFASAPYLVPSHQWTRANYRGAITAELRENILVLLPAARGRLEETQIELMKLILPIYGIDPVFMKALSDHPFDPDTFFPNPEIREIFRRRTKDVSITTRMESQTFTLTSRPAD